MTQKKKIYLVDPDIKRDCLYINDCVDAYLKLAQSKHALGELYNLGSGKQKSIKDIFNTVSKQLNYKIKPQWSSMENRTWDQKNWVSSISKIKKNINWSPKTDLNSGIKNTIKWHKEFYKSND